VSIYSVRNALLVESQFVWSDRLVGAQTGRIISRTTLCVEDRFLDGVGVRVTEKTL